MSNKASTGHNAGSLTTLMVAGTYIGTIVGAGFASGQEVLQFFVAFGRLGLPGLIAVTGLFIWFGLLVMDLGLKLGATSHLPIVRHAGGPILGAIADVIITFFLFGALTAMIAGSGALLEQEFNLPYTAGNALMAIATVVTVLSGFRGIIKAISIVVPFLIITALGVSLFSLFNTAPNMYLSKNVHFDTSLTRNWIWSAVLYTSYNTASAIAILGPLGAESRNRKTLVNGAILGGLGLGLGAIAIYLALLAHLGEIATLEVPMIYLASLLSPAVKGIYAIVLLAEIYTTAVGNLYGFTARLISPKHSRSKAVIIGCTAAAFIASQFGFSNLVRYLYPAVGYGGVLILASLVYNRFSDHSSLRKSK